MAVGFSGSNGGICGHQRLVNIEDINRLTNEKYLWAPLEVSYFVNNACNLKCRHCYVGYENVRDGLCEQEWIDVFEQCLSIGAETFGNVGKEPTLCWDKSKALFQWLADRRRFVPRLRFGLVTNAIRLDEKKIADLVELSPDYIDISLDGVGDAHDAIRGKGTYLKTTQNIAALPPELLEKVFVSFTVNQWNIHTIPTLVDESVRLGLRNVLISPYVAAQANNSNVAGSLLADDHQLVRMCIDIIEGRLLDFDSLEGFNLYVKNDYTTNQSLMNALIDAGVINFSNLWEDDYGVLFTPYTFGTNSVYFNYLPFDTTFRKAIRFSHDGFISNCYDMFFPDYAQRAVGNVREMKISDLYEKLEEHFRTTKVGELTSHEAPFWLNKYQGILSGNRSARRLWRRAG